jgi:hypothetical protein
LQALVYELLGLNCAFTALIAGAQFGTQAAHARNILFLNGLTNLSVGDFLADADVHNKTRSINLI